jgi:hypothetical protein
MSWLSDVGDWVSGLGSGSTGSGSGWGSSWLPTLIMSGAGYLGSRGQQAWQTQESERNRQWAVSDAERNHQWALEMANLAQETAMAQAQLSAEVAMKQLQQQKIRDAIAAVLGGGNLKQEAVNNWQSNMQRPFLR